MESFTEKKIEDAYQIALKLGLESGANIYEKKIFKDLLSGIAVAAVDEAHVCGADGHNGGNGIDAAGYHHIVK
jgi:hypothetical protein